MRTAGLLFLFAAFSLWGAALSARLFEEREQLYQIRRLILQLQNYLQSENMETGQLLLLISQSEEFKKLSFLKQLRFSKRSCPEQLWNDALSQWNGTKPGKEALCSVGRILGRSDSDSQQRQLQSILLTLAPAIAAQEERCQREGKLFVNGGILVGMLAVILYF